MNIVTKESIVSREDILSVITEYDIYRYYFGEFVVNKKYLNHLRGDKKYPSLVIGNKYDHLTHYDFGDDYWRGNCFNLVQQIFRCDLKTAIQIIDRDFGLGFFKEHSKKIIDDVITWKKPSCIEKKKETIIEVVAKRFTKLQLEYWNQFDLSLDDIKEDVYSVKSYKVNGFTMPVEELTFGYLFEEKYWKIYKPVNPNDKWKTNAPIDLMWGLENIKDCESSLVLKSKKDELVARKFLTKCTCGVQNESAVAISDENIGYIKMNSKHPYCLFDNDAAGVKASIFYNDKGFGYWNVPKNPYKMTDIAEYTQRYGGDRLRKQVSKKIQL